MLLVAQVGEADVVLQQDLQVFYGVLQATLLVPGYLILELGHHRSRWCCGRGHRGIVISCRWIGNRAWIGIRIGDGPSQDRRQSSDGDHAGAVGNTGSDARGAADVGAKGGGYVVLSAEGLPPLGRQVLHIRVEIDVGRGQQVIILLLGVGLIRFLLLFRLCWRLFRFLGQGQGLWRLNLGLGQVRLWLVGLLALEEVGDHGALAFDIHTPPAGELIAASFEYLLRLLGDLHRCEA